MQDQDKSDRSGPTLGEELRQDAEKAGSEAQGMAEQARNRAREMAEEARQGARDRADSYKTHAADETNKVAGALRRASEDLSDGSPQERAIAGLANGIADFADGMRSKPLDELVEDAQGFARRNPATFLGGAALIGFALARFGIASERRNDGIGYGSDGYGDDYDADRARTRSGGGAMAGRTASAGSGGSGGMDRGVTEARAGRDIDRTAPLSTGGVGTASSGVASPAIDRPDDQQRGR